MKLHENKTLFRQAVQFTADQMKIPAIYVEKDYWVTYVLFTIFNNELAKIQYLRAEQHYPNVTK
jgi:hypothetical protein